MIMKTIACSCKLVSIQIIGDPILATICHCDDCQTASKQLESLQNTTKILDQYGGTGYILYRKDCVDILDPHNKLRELRIPEEDKTKRLYTSCCNTPMLLDFEPGHWFSFYSKLFTDPEVRPEMRVQTKYALQQPQKEDGIPIYSGFPIKMMFRLLKARIKMLLQKPKKWKKDDITIIST
jgi:hypothetical protein